MIKKIGLFAYGENVFQTLLCSSYIEEKSENQKNSDDSSKNLRDNSKIKKTT